MENNFPRKLTVVEEKKIKRNTERRIQKNK
jgi:hypothetical protein